jgi:TonB family protein
MQPTRTIAIVLALWATHAPAQQDPPPGSVLEQLLGEREDGGPSQAGDGGAPDAGPPGPDVSKMPFNAESVKAVIRHHNPAIQACYEQTLAAGANAAGEVVVAFTITPDGIVDRPRVKSSSLKNESIEDCVVDALRMWYFPKPPRPQPVEFPFKFTEVGAPERGEEKADKAPAKKKPAAKKKKR